MAESTTDVMKKSQENFVRGNRVYILGPFDRSISSCVIPDMLEMIDCIKSEKNAEIEIYINSVGGYATELLSLLSIIDIARSYGIKIITYNIGIAYSCGSILAVIGDQRYMYKYADNMCHLGQAVIDPTTIEQLDRGVKHIRQHFNNIVEIYAKHTKLSKKTLEKILEDDDYHMNANDCKKNGFCDEII